MVMKMKCDPRGSLWRRWDLHFHTPSSFDYKDNSVTNEDIVNILVTAGVRVVAITDHHTIDVPRIRDLQRLGDGKLTVLPGIELRSELGGSTSVHYIGIFSESCDLESVWTKLQSLDLTPADVKAKTDEKIFVPFVKGCELINELGGIVTVHAGKKTNSIEEIGNATEFKQAYKTELLQSHVHALEVGKAADQKSYTEIVFPHIGRKLPILLCSDNHNIKQYTVNVPMWVRADPNFAGLLQLINEPSSRVYLGDNPPSQARVEQLGTKYIDKIVFERSTEAKETEKWFDGEVPLNHGLVAVIGNKGSGKSALADIIALLGNTRASANFGFLNKTRFLEPKKRLGQLFSASMHWRSGEVHKKDLGDPSDHSSPETVKYIPQNFLEGICSDPKHSGFSNELKEVIFSHVGSAQRLGQSSLDDLIEYLTESKTEQIGLIQTELSVENEFIASLIAQLAPQHKKRLDSELNQKNLELKTHDEAKPTEVPAPETDTSTQGQAATVGAEISTLRETLRLHEEELKNCQLVESESSKSIAIADRLSGALTNLERSFKSFEAETLSDLTALGLMNDDIAVLQVKRKPIEDIRDDHSKKLVAAQKQLDESTEGSIASQIKEVSESILQKQLLLDEPNRKHQAYLSAAKEWQERRDQIEGSIDIQGSILQLEAAISDLSELPNRLSSAKERRWALSKQIIEAKEALLEEYKSLYAPIQKSIDENAVLQSQNALQVRARIDLESFPDRFLKHIHQGRSGSFYGDEEGRQRLESLMREASLETQDGTLDFLERIEDHLTYDRRDPEGKPVSIASQLKSGFEVKELMDFVFGLDYLQPTFELRWQEKALDQLSPGERGNLLLIFYLLVDKRDLPLVIDQPEENLDNQTIATMLVPALTQAKARRQIIMVTHNPNLAVVCDADQIIHTHVDKTDGNRVTYVSGAIENPEITAMLLNVLEGTKPAFDLRDAKYGILERYA
jgi:ABC-type lipoprotein export system ATPase subunit